MEPIAVDDAERLCPWLFFVVFGVVDEDVF